MQNKIGMRTVESVLPPSFSEFKVSSFTDITNVTAIEL